jgi:hypothetical protein
MTADAELRQRLAITVRRYWRVMGDSDGNIPSGLLDELEAIATENTPPAAPRRGRPPRDNQFRPQNTEASA